MENLKKHETGVLAIETAWKNGLRLVPDGDMIDIKPMSTDLDPEQSKLIKQMLKQNKENLRAITSNAKGIRETLCDAQETLLRDNAVFLDNLEAWDRLEKAYRMVFLDDVACINGDKGCKDIAIVRCKACEGVKRGV